MSAINRIKFNIDKFFISPSGNSIYAIMGQENTHIDLAKRIINSDDTLKEIFNNVSEELGKIDAISFLIANGYIYMEANPINMDDEIFLIMYNPDSIKGKQNSDKLESFIKNSNCTVYQYNELMEDKKLFESFVSKVMEEKERIRLEAEKSKELQEK